MVIASFEKVLREARKLPFQAQTELVEALLSGAGSSFIKPSRRKTNGPALEILSGMSIDELQTLADAILAPGRQRRLHSLLRKNKTKTLGEKENKEVDELLEESDRIALLKAKAQYTLLKSQHAGEAAS